VTVVDDEIDKSYWGELESESSEEESEEEEEDERDLESGLVTPGETLEASLLLCCFIAACLTVLADFMLKLLIWREDL